MIQWSKSGASGGGERQLELRLETQRRAVTPFAAHQALRGMMKDVLAPRRCPTPGRTVGMSTTIHPWRRAPRI